MLVRVADATEAAEAAAAGVDAVELMLGGAAADLTMPRSVRAAFPRTLRLRIAGCSTDIAALSAAVGADEVALAAEAALPDAAWPEAGPSHAPVAIAVVGTGGDRLASLQRVKGRVFAVMLEAEAPRRLVDETAATELDAFAFACRAAGLPFGLAGGLEAPDVSRLLLLEPDVLGFDVAVRRDHRADAPLDRKALDTIRALVPPHGGATGAPRDPPVIVTDRIFVRDFVTTLSIGAYQAERRARQRVRFSIEAEVARAPVPPHDMRDVFSYDVILETIRVLSQREHVAFVETVAEEIAAALLAHAIVTSVAVKVEKLDVVEGSVGIEITRRRGAR